MAARRNENALQDVEFRLELQQNEQKVDQAYVRLSNEDVVTANFDFNYDLSKEFNKNLPNIYTFAGTEQVAGNVLPASEQTTIIPVGVKVTTTGIYTFAMPDGTDGIGVTLVDSEAGTRTSLSALNYDVILDAGTHDGRFYLEISPVNSMPTGVEEVTGDGLQVTGVRKVVIDGILYIVKDGKMYDARGARVE